jgi:hypothetical protein
MYLVLNALYSFQFFHDLIFELETSQNVVTGETCCENPFHAPELFTIIEERLYLVPLWSGIMIDKVGIGSTRISNNHVENYFGLLKHQLLKGEQVMPSELTVQLYNR